MVLCVFYVLYFQTVNYPFSPSLLSLWTLCIYWALLVVYVVSPACSFIHSLIGFSEEMCIIVINVRTLSDALVSETDLFYRHPSHNSITRVY